MCSSDLDWGLPAVFSEVVLHYGVRIPETLDWPESKDYLRLLEATSRVADVLVGGAEAGALWPAAREALVDLGVPRESCQRCYDEIGDRWKEWGQLLRVPADFSVRAGQIEARAVVPASAASEARDHSMALRVLVVDDEPTSLRLVQALLERKGHEIGRAHV